MIRFLTKLFIIKYQMTKSTSIWPNKSKRLHLNFIISLKERMKILNKVSQLKKFDKYSNMISNVKNNASDSSSNSTKTAIETQIHKHLWLLIKVTSCLSRIMDLWINFTTNIQQKLSNLSLRIIVFCKTVEEY